MTPALAFANDGEAQDQVVSYYDMDGKQTTLEGKLLNEKEDSLRIQKILLFSHFGQALLREEF